MPSTIASPPKNSTAAPITAMISGIGTPFLASEAANPSSPVSLPNPL
jgi:hypothetical protein